MQDYHIYSHYVEDRNISKTNPVSQRLESGNRSQGHLFMSKRAERSQANGITNINKMVYGGLATLGKINSYVGELTENRISASRNATGLTLTGIGYTMLKRPAMGAIALGLYVGDRIIGYEIKAYKENQTARFLNSLSGGTVGTGR